MQAYSLTPAAEKDASEIGLTAEQALALAYSSIPYMGDARVNRRCGAAGFLIEDSTIVAVHRLGKGPLHVQALVSVPAGKVVCPDCDNDGEPCFTCNSTGFVDSYDHYKLS